MSNAEEAKFADSTWYNPFQYKYTSKSNILPSDLYDKLLDSKEAFSNEPSKEIVNGETIFDFHEQPGELGYVEANKLARGEFDHKSALDYSLYIQGYPEWEQAIDIIKTEMESHCGAEVEFRRWAYLPNPNTVTFHFDYFTHLVQDHPDEPELEGIDLSKYFISFLIISEDGLKANTFKAGKTINCPVANGIGLETDVKANQWFMHSQNLGHQYLKTHQQSNHDFFCTCWMIK